MSTYYAVNPYSAKKGGLITAMQIAKQADVDFLAGIPMGFCFVGVPECAETRAIVEDLFKDEQLEFNLVKNPYIP
ncbi:hypothetical protein [Burkholderia cenocepacia]|uniref:hypothetical protein n=1 Tax=Burkholderia cenocepacia TaxID=95486 RepID=UPI000760F5BF|nr:hypothetical protein [Burkholderia cenocepacia]KWU23358.1 hypothetical protein AS149_37440 [Burkholderia cenocepacia]